ncbi:MAG: hypothetical protein AB2A00_21400 [Myxococcota bacterium]
MARELCLGSAVVALLVVGGCAQTSRARTGGTEKAVGGSVTSDRGTVGSASDAPVPLARSPADPLRPDAPSPAASAPGAEEPTELVPRRHRGFGRAGYYDDLQVYDHTLPVAASYAWEEETLVVAPGEGAENVTDLVAQAAVQLADGDAVSAQRLLREASFALQDLHEARMGSGFLERLDVLSVRALAREDMPDVATELGNLAQELRDATVRVDPRVVEELEAAQGALLDGEQTDAAANLRDARQMLTAELALEPVETALAHVESARASVRNRDVGLALRLLQEVPAAMAQVQASAPLVPVRLELRAAADALRAGNAGEAGLLLTAAGDHLQALSEATDPDLAKTLAPLLRDVRRLERQVTRGRAPSAETVDELASRTRAFE